MEKRLAWVTREDTGKAEKKQFLQQSSQEITVSTLNKEEAGVGGQIWGSPTVERQTG